MLQRKSLNNEIPEMTGLLSDYDNNDIPPDSIPPAPPDPWDIDDLLPEEQAINTMHRLRAQSEALKLNRKLGENENGEEFINPMPLWKKYGKLILFHIGLCFLSLLYIIGGAFIFFHFERPNELAIRSENINKINNEKIKMLNHVWEMLNDDSLSKEYIEAQAIEYIDNVTRLLFEAFDTHYITATHLNQGIDSSEDEYSWTITTAIFFTTTLLTTIGYGNLVPTSFYGRLFCIVYALFGVPLILITVADIGKFLSENIICMYGAYTRAKKKINKKYNEKLNNNNNIISIDGQFEGDDDNTKEKDQLMQFGLGNYVAIPILLIVSILLSYMAIGALIIANLEGWHFFEGFYFSFITMTTVGFGDIVPLNHRFFFFDLAYIIVGLAITTMCIDLFGVQYIRKIHYFGRAIKDARFALVNVGGKMVHVPDLMRYASVLQQKYGQKKNNNEDIKGAYAPKDLPLIRYIDYGAMASLDSLSSILSTVFGKSRQPSMV
uniref:Potassium channel domain-containing protein n=1 Tax=Strongyloides stercoralis TaxID=6248 RepID=A0A913I3A7_STRER